MGRLKVKFDEPQHGWLSFVVKEDEEERVRCGASHIFNSLERLVVALQMTFDSQSESNVVWLEEPGESEMVFARQGDAVQLEIRFYADSRHIQKSGDEAEVFRGTYDEICLPFWRALRELQARYPEEEFKKRWRNGFPRRELDLLTQTLGKSK